METSACRFCEGKSHKVINISAEGYVGWQVHCQTCHASGPVTHESKEQAARLWNHNHPNDGFHGDKCKAVDAIRSEFSIPEHMKVTNWVRGCAEKLGIPPWNIKTKEG